MKWQGGRRGGNIEDRRGMSGGQKLTLGGIGGVIVLIIGFLMGGDPNELLDQLPGATQSAQTTDIASTPEEDRLLDFADVVLASTDDVWAAIFQQNGKSYPTPTLVVYRDAEETGGCGIGQSAFGPFYCPADQKIYLDLAFNRELMGKYGAKGEFALAYVIAHEVGHHIQHIFGVLSQTQALRSELSETENNQISVMTELQADFYAGVWAHHLNEITDVQITYQDILDGMHAAAAVGDDHLQEQAYGHSNPESFTHGTSEQRAYWFKKGYDTGDIEAGNTFEDASLQ